jgi:23S rRNA (cytidine1920-2'-O)/16S rRNA (cytidine1409-2'-O)-methyltransferase
MRLDVFLTEHGLSQSRTEAKNLISNGCVKYLGKIISKPSFDLPSDATDVSVDRSSIKYVSRGGEKLAEALVKFDIKVNGKNAIDVGASSGGFTDCLLQNGASRVLSVDSGSGQLVDSIRNDPRVLVYEGYNARFMKRDDFPFIPNLAVMDVSFISATLIMPSLYETLDDSADFVCLIKPQFEVGRTGLGKGGIVKYEKVRMQSVDRVVEFAKSIGFVFNGIIKSPILGGDGNIEFLAHFRKEKV